MNSFSIPVEWVLSAFAILAGVIATLAKVIHSQLKSEIETLRKIVTALQDDVDRLSKGCGNAMCFWKNR